MRALSRPHDVVHSSRMTETLNVRVPMRLADALERAAADKLQTRSEYVRQAVLDRLRRDGVEPNAQEARAA